MFNNRVQAFVLATVWFGKVPNGSRNAGKVRRNLPERCYRPTIAPVYAALRRKTHLEITCHDFLSQARDDLCVLGLFFFSFSQAVSEFLRAGARWRKVGEVCELFRLRAAVGSGGGLRGRGAGGASRIGQRLGRTLQRSFYQV